MCVHVSVPVCMHVCVRVFVCLCFLCMCLCVCVCVCVCVFVYVCTRVRQSCMLRLSLFTDSALMPAMCPSHSVLCVNALGRSSEQRLQLHG